MERWARTQFRVFRINRWSLAMLLLAALALLLLPTRILLPVAGDAGHVVRQGVTLLNRDFSGKTENEARAMLAEMASLLQSSPVPARELKDTSGISQVIPELNGYTLDVEHTWFRLSVAGEGTRVEPATRITSPASRLAHYPQSVIRQGNSQKQAVALLINVDWGTKELTEMLPVLKNRGAKATFFVSGRWADDHKKLLQMMAADGHEIASHGYDLQSGPADLARAGKLKGDIERSVTSIQQITGLTVKYYAPHMSEVNQEILKTSTDLKLRTVLYSLDTVDWMDSTSGEMILARMRRAKAGDLILLHPKPNTSRVLDKALLDLQGRRLQPVTLSEALSPDPGTPSGAWDGQHE